MADDTEDTVATNTDVEEPSGEKRLSLMLVEDNDDDVRIFVELIADHVSMPIDLTLAGTLSEAVTDIMEEKPDVILLDLSLPDSDGVDTYHTMQKNAEDIPIVIMSGNDDEAMALMALGEGVQDYLVKGQVTGSLLMRSLRYAIERQCLITKLKDANNTVNALSSMLPVCSSCKKVKQDDGSWNDLERYLRENTSTRIRQTLCPSCSRRHRI